MRNHPLILLSLIVGAICAFGLGVVSAPHLGVNFIRRPIVTVSLDLMELVTSLRAEKDLLNKSLAASKGRVATLEVEKVDVRRRIAAQTKAALSAKVEGLRRARDRARIASAALTQHKSDLHETLQKNEAMAVKMEGLRRARDEASEVSAAQHQTIATLRRDLSAITENHESRQKVLNSEIVDLREALKGRDRKIVGLQQTIEETGTRRLPAIPPPVAAPPDADVSAQSSDVPSAIPGVLEGVAAYHATDYVKAYGIWRPLAERGNSRAQFHLGALYYEGRGVARDMNSARLWLERATGNGSSLARSLLSRIEEERLAKGWNATKVPATDR